MISYTDSIEGIEPANLEGFFVDWMSKPSPQTHLAILKSSDHVIMAIDTKTGNVAGFITAVSDNILSAYIPLLEVLPQYQHRGIATEMVKRMLAKLGRLYMVDLVCDEELVEFYKRFGFKRHIAMMRRRFSAQSGAGDGCD